MFPLFQVITQPWYDDDPDSDTYGDVIALYVFVNRRAKSTMIVIPSRRGWWPIGRIHWYPGERVG